MSLGATGSGLTLLLVLHGCALPSPEASSPWPSVVAIAAADDPPHCSGAVVGTRTVLTAAHCLQPPGHPTMTPLRVILARGDRRRSLAVERVQRWAGSDVAAVELRRPLEAPALRIAALPVASGDLVSFLSAPSFENDGWRAPPPDRSTVLDVEGQRVFTTASACPGDSGAPLVNDSGELVAIAHASAEGDCGKSTSIFERLPSALLGGMKERASTSD